MKAIVFGSTGLTGSYLLSEMLSLKLYDEVICLGRTGPDIESKFIRFMELDLIDFEPSELNIQAEHVYVCIGTTMKKTPNKERYRLIDHGIPLKAAQLAKESGAEKLLVISSIGADAESSNFYLRTKGEMERDVLESFPNSWIFRPSILTGGRKENRIGESVGIFFVKLFEPLMLGFLKKYRQTKARDLSRAMLNVAFKQNNTRRIESTEIKHLSESLDFS